MGNQTPDDRKQNPQGQTQNRESDRSPQNAAGQQRKDEQRQNPSGQGEGNTIERRADDRGLGRDQQAGGRTGQAGEQMDDSDIERAGREDKPDQDASDSRR